VLAIFAIGAGFYIESIEMMPDHAMVKYDPEKQEYLALTCGTGPRSIRCARRICRRRL